jgi:hypothetical protein
MALELNVREDADRGTYIYYVLHDGAEIPISERKKGNVDKRRRLAAEKQQAEQSQASE